MSTSDHKDLKLSVAQRPLPPDLQLARGGRTVTGRETLDDSVPSAEAGPASVSVFGEELYYLVTRTVPGRAGASDELEAVIRRARLR